MFVLLVELLEGLLLWPKLSFILSDTEYVVVILIRQLPHAYPCGDAIMVPW